MHHHNRFADVPAAVASGDTDALLVVGIMFEVVEDPKNCTDACAELQKILSAFGELDDNGVSACGRVCGWACELEAAVCGRCGGDGSGMGWLSGHAISHPHNDDPPSPYRADVHC